MVGGLTDLPPAMKPEEPINQPQKLRRGLFEADKFWMLLAELFLEKTESSNPLLPVVDQETAVFFTSFAISASVWRW